MYIGMLASRESDGWTARPVVKPNLVTMARERELNVRVVAGTFWCVQTAPNLTIEEKWLERLGLWWANNIKHVSTSTYLKLLYQLVTLLVIGISTHQAQRSTQCAHRQMRYVYSLQKVYK